MENNITSKMYSFWNEYMVQLILIVLFFFFGISCLIEGDYKYVIISVGNILMNILIILYFLKRERDRRNKEKGIVTDIHK